MVRKNKYTHTRQYLIEKKQEAEKLLVEAEHRLLAPLSIHDAVKVEEILKDAFIRFSNDVTAEGKRFLERNHDSKRAKRLLGLADELLKKPYADALKNMNYELLANGQLTSRQLLFLMAEFRDIDTAKIVDSKQRSLEGLKVGQEKAAKNKKERAEEYHELWRKWADETLKANPTWNQDRIAKHVLETATKEGHKMANGNPYKVGTIKKKITGHRKALI